MAGMVDALDMLKSMGNMCPECRSTQFVVVLETDAIVDTDKKTIEEAWPVDDLRILIECAHCGMMPFEEDWLE